MSRPAAASAPRTEARRRSVRILRPGRVPYGEALDLQKRLADERLKGEAPDTLILLEHPPVITLGRGAKAHNVLFTAEALAARGVSLAPCDRGGDVTYHGPGQVVAYPILDLKPDRCDVRRYVQDLEEVMIRCCADHGLAGRRKDGMIGAWLGGEDGESWRKIGAIGVHISRWITTHGIALNVAPDLGHYQLINPCGITEHPVTSLEAELGAASCPAIDAVMDRVAAHFADVFDADLIA
jgi:lipoyl(octanoyl) transferase